MRAMFERFNDACEAALDWTYDHQAAFIGMLVISIAPLIALAVLMSDGRRCVRYGAPTYVMIGKVMTPIANCAEYEEGH